MIEAITCRAAIDTATSATVAIRRLRIQRRTLAPVAGSWLATPVLISRATAVWSAAPGTIRMMNVDSSAASEP